MDESLINTHLSYGFSKLLISKESDNLKKLKNKLIGDLFQFKDNLRFFHVKDDDPLATFSPQNTKHLNTIEQKTVFNTMLTPKEKQYMLFEKQKPKLNVKNFKSKLKTVLITDPLQTILPTNYTEYKEDDAIFLTKFLASLEKKQNSPRKKLLPLPLKLSVSKKQTRNPPATRKLSEQASIRFNKMNSTLDNESAKAFPELSSEKMNMKKANSNYVSTSLKSPQKSLELVKNDLTNYYHMIRHDVKQSEEIQNELMSEMKNKKFSHSPAKGKNSINKKKTLGIETNPFNSQVKYFTLDSVRDQERKLDLKVRKVSDFAQSHEHSFEGKNSKKVTILAKIAGSPIGKLKF